MMNKYKNLENLLLNHRLVLASGSPRRFNLLRKNGISFRQIIPSIDEENSDEQVPSRLAIVLAERKAQAVLNLIEDDEIILGCDTIVILDGNIMGKPDSAEDAFRMLTTLSGKKHTVCSAIALLDRHGRIVRGFELTDVFFMPVGPDEIEKYIATGEPLDKAGAYGIQEQGGFLVDRIAGNVDNVIGLPMTLLDNLAWQMATVRD
jgi:septum formation protein